MKFVDYICNDCAKLIQDVNFSDTEDIPDIIVCPTCGAEASRCWAGNIVIPKKHRAV